MKASKKEISIVLLAMCFFAGLAVYLRSLAADLPSVQALENYTPSLVTKLYDCKGSLITELYAERRSLIPLKEIPLNLQNAVLSAEDFGFFKHWGVSTKGVLRAALSNLIKGHVSQGGSTITQQLAKTIFLTPERTFSRKIKEMLLTIQLERNYSKEEILELYLNQIYFGNGAYGVESAAKIYFGKHVDQLNLPECAMLAGLPRAPTYYSPYKNPQRILGRRSTILHRMRDLKFISDEAEKQANLYPINTDKGVMVSTPIAGYFIEYVRLQLEPKYGSQMIYRGGLSIYTTLDIEAQKGAETAIGEALTKFDSDRKSYFETKKTTFTKVQGALIAFDPKTGGIRAMVGGRDFRESQFNRTTQAMRQPGSSFKPFVYTAAIENGFTPVSVLDDEPLVYVNDGRDWRLAARTTDYLATLPPEWLKDPMKVWVPQNFKNEYHGKVLLRTALEHSLNMCAIRVIEEIGPTRVIDYARRMGIKSPLTNTLSLALGSSDVTLAEMASAMCVIASAGIRTEPYAITRVEDKNGKILEENIPAEKEVLSPQTCFVMTNILRGVTEHGTGVAARALGRPCAGKTGTTNDFTDAWFIGFTPQLVAGVWVGYDDRTWLGNNMTGGSVSCPIWTRFMKLALDGQPVQDFTPPDGVVFSMIDPKTGLLSLSNSKGAYLEAFIKGTEPKDYFAQRTPSKEKQVNGVSDEVENAGGF
jgi:penicillin-binding protein 1A